MLWLTTKQCERWRIAHRIVYNRRKKELSMCTITTQLIFSKCSRFALPNGIHGRKSRRKKWPKNKVMQLTCCHVLDLSITFPYDLKIHVLFFSPSVLRSVESVDSVSATIFGAYITKQWISECCRYNAQSDIVPKNIFYWSQRNDITSERSACARVYMCEWVHTE